MKNLAREHFHRPPERLNCAQAVLYAYQQITGDRILSIVDFKPFGGGRAPEGLCGALHAACAVAPSKAENLRRRFAEATGSLFCKELKGVTKVPCDTCVSTAAEILHSELELTRPGTAEPNEPNSSGI
jgi:hypothetical protein